MYGKVAQKLNLSYIFSHLTYERVGPTIVKYIHQGVEPHRYKVRLS
jgi:hypothetical protein